jgi:biopolymer transport protein ExbD
MLRTRRTIQDGIPTSSMADVAFLLLVFFLVTTVFPKDRGLSLVLPQGETPVSAANVMHLLIEQEGAVTVRMGASPLTRRIAPAEVEDVWRAAVASRPGLIASVRTGSTVSYGAMVDVLDALTAAGARRVSLGALEGR